MFTAPQLIPEAEAGRGAAAEAAFEAPPMQEGTAPTKWEYFYVLGPLSKLEAANAMGAEGWELVDFVPSGAWIFKRPLP